MGDSQWLPRRRQTPGRKQLPGWRTKGSGCDIRQRERSRCDSVRHLLVCTHRLRVERTFSARFTSIDDHCRNRSSPIEFFNSPANRLPGWLFNEILRLIEEPLPTVRPDIQE